MRVGGLMGQTSKGSGGGQETKTNVRVHGGRGVVEVVCETGEMEDRGTIESPVLPWVAVGAGAERAGT